MGRPYSLGRAPRQQAAGISWQPNCAYVSYLFRRVTITSDNAQQIEDWNGPLVLTRDAILDRVRVGGRGITFHDALPDFIRAGALPGFLRQLADPVDG